MKSFVIFLLLNNENRVSRHEKKLGPLSMELDKEEMMVFEGDRDAYKGGG